VAGFYETDITKRRDERLFTINMAGVVFILRDIAKKRKIKILDQFRKAVPVLLSLVLVFLSACASHTGPEVFHDPNFDLASVRVVAVMPFENLTKETLASSRVRDVFMNMLLSAGAIYVLPSGEVARGMTRTGIEKSTALSAEDAVKLGGTLKADAVITGVVREYGELRSSTTVANVVSLSLQMIETQTGKVVWTAASTKGGITVGDRLFGGGGQPMDDVTRAAVIDVLNKLF
jgi:hypothetical protein